MMALEMFADTDTDPNTDLSVHLGSGPCNRQSRFKDGLDIVLRKHNA